jgi:hypothetical protein
MRAGRKLPNLFSKFSIFLNHSEFIAILDHGEPFLRLIKKQPEDLHRLGFHTLIASTESNRRSHSDSIIDLKLPHSVELMRHEDRIHMDCTEADDIIRLAR